MAFSEVRWYLWPVVDNCVMFFTELAKHFLNTWNLCTSTRALKEYHRSKYHGVQLPKPIFFFRVGVWWLSVHQPLHWKPGHLLHLTTGTMKFHYQVSYSYPAGWVWESVTCSDRAFAISRMWQSTSPVPSRSIPCHSPPPQQDCTAIEFTHTHSHTHTVKQDSCYTGDKE